MADVVTLPGDCSADDIIETVDRDGVAIVKDFVSRTWLDDFNSAIQTSIDDYTPYDYGEPEAAEFLGHRTVRLNGIVSKAPNYVDLMTDERLLAVMDHFLGPNCGQFRLNSSEIIEIHGGETAQELHTDDMIWPVSGWMPDKLLQFNVMVAATDFTGENGATNVVPGSHKWEKWWEREVKPDEIAQAVMTAGSAVFIPGHTVHGGGTNTDGTVRRAIVASYVLGWLRSQENHFLHTTVEQVAELPERARQLLGYDLYAYHQEDFFGGPLGYYEYGSPQALFTKSGGQ